MKVGVLDYGVGNLGSVLKAVEALDVSPVLVDQAGEMARQVACAANVAGHGDFRWRPCSSTLMGSRIDHLAQQERTAGW